MGSVGDGSLFKPFFALPNFASESESEQIRWTLIPTPMLWILLPTDGDLIPVEGNPCLHFSLSSLSNGWSWDHILHLNPAITGFFSHSSVPHLLPNCIHISSSIITRIQIRLYKVNKLVITFSAAASATFISPQTPHTPSNVFETIAHVGHHLLCSPHLPFFSTMPIINIEKGDFIILICSKKSTTLVGF